MKTGSFKLLVLLDIFTFIATLAYSETTNATFSLATTEATAITASSAELHGTINPGGTSAAAWFEWGTTASFGNRTDTRLVGDGTTTVNLSQSIGNLQPRTTYYFRIVGYHASGNVPGETRTFTTSGDVTTTTILTTTTGDAADVTSNSAILVGTVNPGGPATAWFEWGTTTGLGNRTEAQAFTGIGSPANVSIPARQQVAKFVNELFGADTIGSGFRGSLRLQSSTPFAVVGLRFSGYVFSTLPVAVTAPVPGVPSQTLTAGATPNTPQAGTVGGPNALIIPQFAIAGGWATQIALINNTTSTLSGRIDLFDTAGNPMGVNLNGETRSTFTYSSSVGGTFVLAPRDSNGQSPL